MHLSADPIARMASGRELRLLNPTPEAIDPVDIAEALSSEYACEITRCTQAERAVQLSLEVGAPNAFQALCWQMLPAYLRALPVEFRDLALDEIESRLWATIAKRFGVDELIPQVTAAAWSSLQTKERRLLVSRPPLPCPAAQRHDRLRCFPPDIARVEFLSRFIELAMDRVWDRRDADLNAALCALSENRAHGLINRQAAA